MSAPKIIAIVLLVTIGAHLLLYGFIRRKIAEAQRQKDARDGK